MKALIKKSLGKATIFAIVERSIERKKIYLQSKRYESNIECDKFGNPGGKVGILRLAIEKISKK